MKKGYLSQYFEKVAIKRLSAVEASLERSNQHEFNGSKPLKELFGLERLNEFPVQFIWLGKENEGITDDSYVTWYNARENNPNRSAEYRLYFKSNTVMQLAEEGDLLIIAKRPTGEIYIIVVSSNTTYESQLLWLFDFDLNVDYKFSYQQVENEHDQEINFAVRYILEEIGIEIDETDEAYLDTILEPYIDKGFPTTVEFSTLARDTVKEVCSKEYPDEALILWVEQEEKLFKRLERHLVAKKIKNGFMKDNEVDVDGFLKFSLSVQNRRKSRAGLSLENHLEQIFKDNSITYSRNKITENRSRPDFIFPSIEKYHDKNFNPLYLTMLGVKSTCKDRWRQVLAEADRIEKKHLFTLEPSISVNQTNEMEANKLQLVLPKQLHYTYNESQQKKLLDLEEFIQIVRKKNNR